MITTKLLAKFAFSLALVLAVVAIVTTIPVRLEAQAISGDLTGKITDASGAVVPNATVEAVNLATSQKITTTTNSNGEYHFTNMPVGHYRLTASGNGLTGGYGDVRVDLSKTATANITATIGAAATTVEVVDQAATIDTTTAQIQTNYDPKQVQDLPTASVGLGVLNLSLLQAGVASSGGVGAGTGPSVSGQRPRNNNFTVEGVDNNDKSVTGPLVTVPNDAVENFTVLQNNFSPEFGHSSGGQFNQVVMSGTNKFHGRAYEYFQNRKLNGQDTQVARSQRNQIDPITGKSATVENTRYDNNRFGGQIGGPIIKDKLFFFHNSDYNPIGTALSSSGCAPTSAGYALLQAQATAAAINQNNFTVMKTYLPAAGQVANPAFGSPCPTAATVNGVDIPVGDIGFTGSSFSNTYTTVNSIDLNPTNSDQVRFRYIYSHFTGFDTAANLPTFWTTIPARYHVATFSEFHTFSPKVTNEFRVGFNRFSNDFPVGAQKFPGLAEFPNLNLDELNGTAIGPDGNAPQFGIQNTYQVTDNVSWLMGKHNLKFGIEGRKYISPSHFVQRERGDYYWSTLEGYLLDQSPDDFAERSTGHSNYIADQYAIYAFVNDEFRLTSHLTLNLGGRYEFTSVPAGLANQALNSAASVPGLINFGAPTAQKKNFAPRVGFAYSPGNSGDTSIRGGYAMAYDVLYDNLGTLSLPPQLSATCDVGTTQSSYCHWSDTAFLATGGLPQQSPVFPDVLAQRAATGAFVPNQKLPYSESWNIGIQHVFAKKYIAEVRYVGTRGLQLPVQNRLNRQSVVNSSRFLPTYLAAPSAATIAGATTWLSCPKVGGVETCPAGVTSLSKVNAAGGGYVPAFYNAGFTSSNVVGFMPEGSSKYNGMQAQLTRNFSNGLQFQAAWTWSHAFDNSTADVFSTLLTPRRSQDFQCVNCDWSPSALDRRHRITVQMIYDMPFFKKDSNWLKKNILGNWELAPIYTFQSPEYATVQSSTDSNLNGDSFGDRSIINPSGKPGTSTDVTAIKNASGSVVGYLATDPSAYYIRARSGALANARRNTLPLPRINNWDLTAVKRFSIREGMNFEFQAQALNLFNHSQFVPGSLNQVNSIGFTSNEVRAFLTPGSSSFNQPSDVFSQQPRSMQLALKFTF